MLKIAIAEIDISNNKRYFFIAIYKLVKVVYIYHNRTKYDFLPKCKKQIKSPMQSCLTTSVSSRHACVEHDE